MIQEKMHLAHLSITSSHHHTIIPRSDRRTLDLGSEKKEKFLLEDKESIMRMIIMDPEVLM
jgi:hypothetical protein